MNNKTLIKIIILVTVLTGIAGYSYYEAKKLLMGPVISILSPTDGSTSLEQFIEIKGETKNVNYIEMNGRPIFINEKGEFKEKLLLSEGYNIIRVAAKDKFEKMTEEKLEIIYAGKEKIDSHGMLVEKIAVN